MNISIELLNEIRSGLTTFGKEAVSETVKKIDSLATATVSPNEISVRYSSRPDVGRDYLTIDVPNDWDDVKKICKKVLVYDGRRFTFTGWNSDRHECFFSAPLGGSEPVATVVRK